MYLESELKR